MKPKSHSTKLRSSNALISLISTVTVCFGAASMASAAWEGNISTDWNVAGNWNPAGVPTAIDASINTTPANIATISSAVPNVTRLLVGSGGSTNGTLILAPLAGITSTGDVITGEGNTGKGTLNVTGGTLTSPGHFLIGNGAGSTGVVNVSGGTVSSNGGATGTGNDRLVRVGYSGGNGTLNVSGGTLSKTAVGNFIVGSGANSVGKLVQTGGTVNVANEFWAGSDATATGVFQLDAGTFNVNSWFVLGRTGGKGTLNMSGGTLVKNTAGTSFIVGGNGAADVGIMNQSGGLVNVNAGDTWIAENGTGTITLTGGEFRANYFQAARNASAFGNVFVKTGGTLSARQISGGAGTEDFHFDGGQVIARESQAAFITGAFNAGSVKIDAGGFKIDSNGFNIGTAQELTGVGGIVKSGLGTFRVNGTQSFAGGIQVSGGKLLRGSAAGTLAGTVTVAAGAGFGPAVTTNTDQSIITNLSQASGSSLDVDLGNFLGNPTVAVLDVTGTVDFAGPVTINLNDQLPAVGPIKLMRFVKASATGVTLANIVPGTLPPGVRLNAVTPFTVDLADATYGYIIANVSYASQSLWAGNVDGKWNLTTPNWQELNTEVFPALFTQGSSVLFNDTADSSDVVLDASVDVKPDLVTFNNSSTPYTLTGTGKISDSVGTSVKTSLVKNGSGSLLLATPNTFTGPTKLSGGITSVPTLANGGSASPIGASTADRANLILNGGTLDYTGAAAVIDRGFTIAAANSGISAQISLEMKGGVSTTAGNLIKTGPGNLILSNDSANGIGLTTPGLRVTEGTLTLKGAGAQTNAVTGEMWVSNTPDVSANLVLNNTSLTTTNFLAIGRGNGTTGAVCNMTVTASTMNTVNFSAGYHNNLAANKSTQNINLTNSTWTNTGVLYLAESAGSTTTAVFDAVTYSSTGAVVLGRGGPSTVAPINPLTSTGSLTMKNGSQMTKSAGITNIGENGIGFLELQDSSSFISNGGELYIGANAISNGTVNVKGTSTLSVLGDNALRVGNTGKGILNQSGGTVNVGGWAIIGRYDNTVDVNAVSELNISGGTYNQATPERLMIIGEQGKGIVNLSGTGAINAAGSIVVSNGPTGKGTFNIGAGTTVTTQAIIKGTGNGGGGSSAVYFDGGLVKVQAAATAAVFMTGLDTAQVKAGGLKIDTNGKDIVINQAITNDGGVGTFNKTGAGRLTMNGSMGLNGDATISAGGLSGTGPINCPLKISAGADVNPGAAGGQGTLVAGLDMTFAAGSSLTVDLGAGTELLSVFSGQLALGGATLNVTGSPSQSVSIVAEYGTLTGTFANVPSGYSIDYNYNNTNQIALIQTSTPYSTWANATITAIQSGADASPGGNPDNDGLTNSAEFALNSNPLSGESSGRVVSKIANVGGVPSLVLSLPVRKGAVFSGSPATTSALVDGLIYKIEGSAALAAWNLPVTEVTGADKTAIETGLPDVDPANTPDQWEYRTFTTGPVSTAPKAFMRTVIGQP